MTYLRNQSRLVHETVYRHIKHHLGQLGWLTEGSVPYGSIPLNVMSIMPPEYENVSKLEPGTAVVSIGPRFNTEDQEMGSDLVVQEYPIFFDVFMDKEAVADAVADDVFDILKGRLPGTAQALKVWDFTQAPPQAVDGWRIELTDLETDHGPNVRNWSIVRVTAQLEFMDSVTDVRTSSYPSASIFATPPIPGAATLTVSVGVEADGGT